MGRHDQDPHERLRYVLTAVIFLVVIVLLLLGVSELHALAWR
jgi:hypothetical protein